MKSFVGSELELMMLVLVVVFFKRKKVNFIEEGSWGFKAKQKLMVDLEIKVVLLDSIVKEGFNSFQE